MKWPKCKTENGGRTICKNCGKFLNNYDINNRAKMTKSERAREDAKIVGKKFKKIFSYIWIIIVLVIMSGWFIYLLLAMTNGGGGFGG